MLFVLSVDLQLVLGLILYIGLSPFTQAAFHDFGGAMKDRQLRFFSVEHTTYMVVAVVLAHVARIFERKAAMNSRKWRPVAISYCLSLLLIVAGIPWWRPLLRFGE
jgi:hypothetical protein